MGGALQVWEAVQELRSGGSWVVEGIRQVAPAFEAKLAAGQPHDLPALAVPPTPPGVPETAGSMEVHLPASCSPSHHPFPTQNSYLVYFCSAS